PLQDTPQASLAALSLVRRGAARYGAALPQVAGSGGALGVEESRRCALAPQTARCAERRYWRHPFTPICRTEESA
ncbi:MAG: hypothetical protein ACO3QC_09825, partial [Phycisphaerales bacterium]